MIHIRHVIGALILLPAIAGAQMGRAGSQTATSEARRARGSIDRDNAPPMKLKVGDLEDISPVKMLIDERKKLKLTDEQQAKLKELRGTVDKANEPLFAKFDSLRIVLRPRQNPTDEEMVRMALGREELGPLVRSIRANYAATVAPAMALLDDAQKAVAQGLMEKQATEADEMFRDKMGGARMGGGGGPGGGRGRPPLE